MTSAEKGEGSRNAANLQTNCKDFVDKEGFKKTPNLIDVIYGNLPTRKAIGSGTAVVPHRGQHLI